MEMQAVMKAIIQAFEDTKGVIKAITEVTDGAEDNAGRVIGGSAGPKSSGPSLKQPTFRWTKINTQNAGILKWR